MAAWVMVVQVITPFYDSLLVKVIASAHNYEDALQRMRPRALGISYSGREDKYSVSSGKCHPARKNFAPVQATTTLIDTSPELVYVQNPP